MRYAIAIEPGEHNYSAYVPDVPGCVATGSTVEEVTAEIRDALTAHLALTAEYGEPVPQPTTIVAYVDVPVHVPAR
jgi:predicted RNase H-like HicB family nuclease